jgi:hypothetical protein
VNVGCGLAAAGIVPEDQMSIDDNATAGLPWRTSSFCSSSTCVEVAFTEDSVVVRDSKNQQRQPLVYNKGEWRDFIAGVKSGEFDLS